MAHPIDAVVIDNTPVGKAGFRGYFKSRARLRCSVAEVVANDFSLQTGGLDIDGAFYNMDTADHITAHDGVNVLVDFGGNRFKLGYVSIPLYHFPAGGQFDGPLQLASGDADMDPAWPVDPASPDTSTPSVNIATPVFRTPHLNFGGTGNAGVSGAAGGVAIINGNRTVCYWNNSLTLRGVNNNPSLNVANEVPGQTGVAGSFRFQSYTVATITNVANNGAGKVRLTVSPTTNEYPGNTLWIYLCSIGGIDGKYTSAQYTIVDATHIDLINVAFAAGGAATGFIADFVTPGNIDGRVLNGTAGSLAGEWRCNAYVAGVNVEHWRASNNEFRLAANIALSFAGTVALDKDRNATLGTVTASGVVTTPGVRFGAPVTLADDIAISFAVPGGKSAIMLLAFTNNPGATAPYLMLAVRADTALAPTAMANAGGVGNLTLGTTALANNSVDGVDGNWNVNCPGDGKVYVKNRLAANRIFAVAFEAPTG